MTSSRQRNDSKARNKPRAQSFSPAAKARRESRLEAGGADLLWGWHAVSAALANPAREAPIRLYATQDRARQIKGQFGDVHSLEIADNAAISHLAPQGAVHQGVLLKTPALESLTLEDVALPTQGVLIMLDQITDPQNIGAIFRSAAAFGARGVILQDRHAPALSGALSKAAAGAVDIIPHVRVVNLSRALETLNEMGWRSVGLDAKGSIALADAFEGGATVLVMGSEGEGLRRLVAEHCDVLCAIPMPGGFESLNVSNATAIALYEASRSQN